MKLKQTFYIPVSQWVFKISNPSRLKLKIEAIYWLWVKWRKGLSHTHYEYFFKEYFGLSDEDYLGKRVLDIGCGPRGSLEWANQATERIGLDPLANFYAKLNKTLNMKLLQGNAESIPFADGYFDVVTSFNSLDHVDDLEQAIKEIKRVTKSGGLFLLIADVHSQPTLCEPSAFDWSVVNRFEPEFVIEFQRHYEGERLYKSIRAGVSFDHSNLKKRFGVLTAKLRRK